MLDPFRVVVVDSEHEQLTAAEQAAVEAYEGWFERFDPEQDASSTAAPTASSTLTCVSGSDRGSKVRRSHGSGLPYARHHLARVAPFCEAPKNNVNAW